MNKQTFSVPETFRTLSERAGLSMQEMAKLMGYAGPSSIQRYESADFTKDILPVDLTDKIANALVGKGSPPITDLEVRVLSNRDLRRFNVSDLASAVHVPNGVVGNKIKGEPARIKVYGQAVGGVDGEFEMNGNVLDTILAPPQISEISDAYAVIVSGDSMSPRYEDGETAFIDPRRRVRKGDYVIAQIRKEEHGAPLAYIKRFERHNANELVLSQFNPPKELIFPASSVVSVHFIALAGIA